MDKPKFDRSKPRVNIAEATKGYKADKKGNSGYPDTLDFFRKIHEEYKVAVLRDLVNKYGFDEGVRQFYAM